MMKSIIKCLSWKLSKQFFIILLISCFTLLGNSFVNAIDCDWIEIEGWRAFWIGLGIYWIYNSWNNNCWMNIDFDWSIDWNFNFNDNVFRYNAVESYWDTYFWRTSEGLKYQFNRYNSTTVYNWLIVWFFACSEMPAFWSNYYLKNVSSCTYHSWFDSLSAYLQNPSSWWYLTKLTTNNSNMAICVYANNNYICFDRSNAVNTSTSLISYSESKAESILNPFVDSDNSNTYEDSDIIWVFEDDDHLQNRTYMEILESLGYSTWLCYSNFNIDSLWVAVDSSQCLSENCVFSQFIDDSDCDDSELFCGASVLDLKAWFLSGANDRVWFQNFYNIRKSSYNHYNINWYVWKSKGYWYLPYKLYNAVEDERLNFDPDDYFYYCRNVINWYDPNAYKTWWVSNDVKDAINEKWSVVLSGVDFSWSKDLFWLFNNFYTKLKDWFKVDDSYHDITWMLPSYIIFWFFLFVLLYWLKR